MEVGLGQGDFVFDGGPATPRTEGTPTTETGTAAPIFSARVYCGNGRPSQLLLSSCYTQEII